LAAVAAPPGSARAQATPACEAGTLASYFALGAGGCTVGGADGLVFDTFRTFARIGNSGPTYPAGITLSPVAVTLADGRSAFGFDVFPGPHATIPSGIPGGSIGFVFGSAVRPVGSTVAVSGAFALERSGSSTGDAGFIVSARLGPLPPVVPANNFSFEVSSFAFGAGSSASLTSARVVVAVSPVAPPHVIPEPSTYALLGTGLASVGMMVRRRARA
jgi:hypothetical protein